MNRDGSWRWVAMVFAAVLFLAGRAPAGEGQGIDWDKAKDIYQRSQRGEKLTAEDQAYLDRAKAEVQQGRGPGKAGGQGGVSQKGDDGTGIDWNKARDIYQRLKSGEQVTADEKAYLEKAKAARQGGGAKQTGPDAAGIDWNKAVRLFRRSQNGETLTPDEQAYLEKAKAAKQGGGGQGAPPQTGKDSTGLVPLADMKEGQTYKEMDGGL